jgi:hypothetical protein
MGFLYILREKLLPNYHVWNINVIEILREREIINEWACTTDIEASKITSSSTILVSRN